MRFLEIVRGKQKGIVSLERLHLHKREQQQELINTLRAACFTVNTFVFSDEHDKELTNRKD